MPKSSMAILTPRSLSRRRMESARRIADEHAFGDLELEPPRRKSRLDQDGMNEAGQIAVAKLRGRQVDADCIGASTRRPGGRPRAASIRQSRIMPFCSASGMKVVGGTKPGAGGASGAAPRNRTPRRRSWLAAGNAGGARRGRWPNADHAAARSVDVGACPSPGRRTSPLAPIELGPIERRVGIGEKRHGIGAVARIDRGANAERDRN